MTAHEPIRDVATRVSERVRYGSSAQDRDAGIVASWVLAVTEPCGDVPSVEDAQRATADEWAVVRPWASAVLALHARLADERAKVAALEAGVARLREDPAARLAAERERFEAWASTRPFTRNIKRIKAGRYFNYQTESAWQGWLAALGLDP